MLDGREKSDQLVSGWLPKVAFYRRPGDPAKSKNLRRISMQTSQTNLTEPLRFLKSLRYGMDRGSNMEDEEDRNTGTLH